MSETCQFRKWDWLRRRAPSARLRLTPQVARFRRVQRLRWARQHVPDASETGKGKTSAALSQLKVTDRRENKPAREEPEQKRHNLDTEPRQHDALVGHQPAIPCLRDIRC